MKHRLIYLSEDKTKRIIEVIDEVSTIEDLVGDCFNLEVNTDIDTKQLEIDFVKFKRSIEDDGVYGYISETWNAAPDCGWEHADSCFGFIGQYEQGAEGYDHYIVDELKRGLK